MGMRHTLLGIILTLMAGSIQADVIRLATTTSTQNSGLLDYLLPHYEEKTGDEVHVIAVGTGKALRMGADGDVDVLMVHAPPAEEKFIAAGHGVDRKDLMYNDFVIVGPSSDPAGIQGTRDVAEAMRKIARSESLFISRGDDSGTHKKERRFWDAAGIDPSGSWYREAGQGMGKVLQMAGELDGYTLADRGTWLAYKSKSPLKVVMEGDARMQNPYGVIAVNPARYPDINHEGAQRFIGWLVSPEAQKLIGQFKINGEQLFIPSARQ